ncbi:MAG TPA: hypothetical protein PLK35_02355 [Candidatus Moranbacteria bacterium]|nr:hypothetical protein [Candidatus Moranbacteria bacterium]
MKRKILLGLTTTPKSDWRAKVREIDRLELREIALFPTFLEPEERKELYDLLKNTKLQKIPHVHLRDDMEEWELEYFSEKYGTSLFNIHANRAGLEFLRKTKVKNKVYIENILRIDEGFLEGIKLGAGICLDISHWEDLGKIQKNEGYEKLDGLIKKYKVGCSHISAVAKKASLFIDPKTKEELWIKCDHFMSDFSQLDYVKDYVQYLPEYASIELENSFEEQLKIKEYLEKIINPVG